MYCSVSDVRARLPLARLQQVFETRSDADIDAGIGLYITDMSARIDGFLAQRYELALLHAAPPASLLGICADLVLYRLWGHGEGEEAAVDKYNMAIAWLNKIQQGKVDLPDAPEGSRIQAGGGLSVTTRRRIFSEDFLDRMP